MKSPLDRPAPLRLEQEVVLPNGSFHSFRVLWRYLPYCRRHWPKLLLVLLITSFAGTVLNAIIPLLSGFLLDEAFPRRNYALVVTIVVAILGTYVLKETNYLLEQFIRYNVKMEIFRELGNRFYHQLLRLSLGYHVQRPVGERIFRAFTDVHDASRMLGFSLPMAVSMIIQGLVTTAVTALIDWRPVVVIACFLPPYMILAQAMTTRWRRSDRRVREMRQNVTAHLQQTLAAVNVVQAATQEQSEKRRYVKKLSSFLRSFYVWNLFTGFNEAFIHPAGLAVTFTAMTGFLWGYFYINGTLSLGQWLALQMMPAGLIYNVLIPASTVVINFQTLRREMVAAERVLEVMDLETRVPEKRHPVRLRPVIGRIEFRNVSFGYRPDFLVLRDVSFTIEPGEVVAFVGASGSGKSTIINLILRFQDPEAGQVLLDGHDLRDLALDDTRRQLGVVLQTPYLFAGTVRENLVYGFTGATNTDIAEAIELAQCRTFIDQMPDGLETMMGEKGDLSGGQKQRLTIARALVRNPRVLLLDEPLASVDVDAELRIAEALHRATSGRTTLYATNNLPSIRQVDRIFVLDKGEIVERGGHEELLAQGGLYAKMTAEIENAARGAARGEQSDEPIAETLA